MDWQREHMISEIMAITYIFLSFLVSSIAGFAGAAFAVPLTASIIGLENARCAVNIISIAFNATISIQQRKNIKIKEIVPILMIIFLGMGFGVFINSYITSEEVMLRILGSCILLLSGLKLLVDKEMKLNKWRSFGIIFVSGIVNYMFLCGGIILVLYMGQKYRNKDQFRGTNGIIFLLQSILMFFLQQSKGMYNQESYLVGLLGIVPVIIATMIGKKIVKKISQKHFEKITYILLMIMAIMLIL